MCLVTRQLYPLLAFLLILTSSFQPRPALAHPRMSIHVDGDGVVYFLAGVRGPGIWRLDSDGQLTLIPLVDEEGDPLDLDVHRMAIDEEGRFYLSLTNRLFQISPQGVGTEYRIGRFEFEIEGEKHESHIWHNSPIALERV